MRTSLLYRSLASALVLLAFQVERSVAQAPPQDKPPWTITALGTPDLISDSANAINNTGQVVGGARTKMGRQRAFVWQDGRMSDLMPTEKAECSAFAINDKGSVAGALYNLPGGKTHAFLYSGGVMHDLNIAPDGHLTLDYAAARGINGKGQVVGTSGAPGSQHPILWQDGVPLDLYPSGFGIACGITDQGEIVGSVRSTASGANRTLAIWRKIQREGGVMEFSELSRPEGVGSGNQAWAISAKGDVVGKTLFSKAYQEQTHTPKATSYGERAFLWQAGQVMDLGVVRSDDHQVEAHALNNRGQVVGTGYREGTPGVRTPGDGMFAFLWQDGKMTDLNDLLPPDSGWEITMANGINEGGQIVGMGLHNGHRTAFLMSPPPQNAPA